MNIVGQFSWAGIICILINLFAGCGIVFANKAVFQTCKFNFTVALTCIHTIVTLIVARVLRWTGFITPKRIPRRSLIALAAAFTGYIVLCNASLELNTVGFYQLLKIAGAPTMMIIGSISQRQLPKVDVSICVFVTCLGIGLATVTDRQVTTNLPGLVIGVVSVLVTSQYGLWIGSMSKYHNVSSLQLLEQYLPFAAVFMALCVPLSQVLNSLYDARKGLNLYKYEFTSLSVAMIATSAVLGALVTFSTFALIGLTSPLSYAIVGHVKTIVILLGGVFLFHDEMTSAKGIGVLLALCGVIGYTVIESTRK